MMRVLSLKPNQHTPLQSSHEAAGDHLIYYLVPCEQTSGKQIINICNCWAEPLWLSWQGCRLHRSAFHLPLPTLAEHHCVMSSELTIHSASSPFFLAHTMPLTLINRGSHVDKQRLHTLLCANIFSSLDLFPCLYAKFLTCFCTRIICRSLTKSMKSF